MPNQSCSSQLINFNTSQCHIKSLWDNIQNVISIKNSLIHWHSPACVARRVGNVTNHNRRAITLWLTADLHAWWKTFPVLWQLILSPWYMLQWELKQLRCIRGNGLGEQDQPQEDKNHYRSPATQCMTEEMHPPVVHTQSQITAFSCRLMLTYYITHNKS